MADTTDLTDETSPTTYLPAAGSGDFWSRYSWGDRRRAVVLGTHGGDA